jgi:hypothetical protein
MPAVSSNTPSSIAAAHSSPTAAAAVTKKLEKLFDPSNVKHKR